MLRQASPFLCSWLAACLLLVGTQLSWAQPMLQYGVKGGLNFATLFGDTYNNLGPKPGFVLGAYGTLPFNDNISFQAEVNFSQEGAQNPSYDFSTFSTVIYNQRLRYTYIQIPLMIKYHLSEVLSLTGGPQVGIRLYAKETRKIKSGEPSPSDNSEGTRTFTNRIKPIYPSFTVGAEYEIQENLKAQARFFFSIFDNVTRRGGDSEGTYPLILQLTVSYELGQKTLNR